MLTVVLYGRNDSYGYNLHKRAALALNCIAEILSDDADEILFVDYNTPDDYPTFPEAIADTLTDKATARLRILRVRPAVHDRWKARTHLKALEPVARNVAIRRSNPDNRWILSTNTDMIFVPRPPWDSLSDIVADLPRGFYHLPRFELPESLWEGFDRRDPAGVIEQVRGLGRSMFLNEIVYGNQYIKYDGPGDFQLVARDDLFRIHGFDEEMLLGWHVDSNLAKRLHVLHGAVSDVVDRLFGYHCDHTRQVTAAHQHNAERNDAGVFVDDVVDPPLPAQAESWGCAGDDIEEITLQRSAHHVYRRALRSVITGEWAEPVTARYTPDSFDEATYDARHVLPFLADLFVSAPRQWTLGWIGGRADTFQMFSDVWRRFGFTGIILIEEWSQPLLVAGDVAPDVRVAAAAEIDRCADVLVFDFGAPSASSIALDQSVVPARLDHEVDKLARQSFVTLLAAERVRLRAGAAPRRVICVNAIHNRYEALIKDEIGFAATPFATRLRHGFATPRSLAPPAIFVREDEIQAVLEEQKEEYEQKLEYEQQQEDNEAKQQSQEERHEKDEQSTRVVPQPPNLLDRMYVGDGGRRVPAGVLAPFGRRGYVVSGPYDVLPVGRYRVEFSIRSYSLLSLAAYFRPVILEVVEGAKLLAQAHVTFFVGAKPTLTFSVSEDDRPQAERGIEFRIFRGRLVDFVVTSVRLIQLATLSAPVSDFRAPASPSPADPVHDSAEPASLALESSVPETPAPPAAAGSGNPPVDALGVTANEAGMTV